MQENLLWVKKLSDTEFQNDVLIVAGAVISTARVVFVWVEFIYKYIYIYLYTCSSYYVENTADYR